MVIMPCKLNWADAISMLGAKGCVARVFQVSTCAMTFLRVLLRTPSEVLWDLVHWVSTPDRDICAMGPYVVAVRRASESKSP